MKSRRTFLSEVVGAFAFTTLASSTGRAALGALADGDRLLLDRLLSPAQRMRGVPGGDGYIYFNGAGLPDHATGAFPNPNCPGPILAQTQRLRISASPSVSATPRPLDGWLFGVAVNGVVFDPTGPFYFRDGLRTDWHFEVMARGVRPHLGLDDHNAHTQPSGEYHYHALPIGLIERLSASRERRREGERMLHLGWAADGFPVYAPIGHASPHDPHSPLVVLRSSYVLRSGPRGAGSPGGNFETAGGTFVQDWEYRPGAGHLDECNGRHGVTPEFPSGTYYYVVTHDFPFIPRAWRGVPDATFTHPNPLTIDAVPRALRSVTFS